MRRVEIAGRLIPFVRTGEITAVCGLTADQHCVGAGDEPKMRRLILGGGSTAVVTGVTPMPEAGSPEYTDVPERLKRRHRYDRLGYLALRANIIGQLHDGSKVFMQRTHSHASTHCRDDIGLEPLIRRALPNLMPPCKSGYSEIEFDFGKYIGLSELVEVHPGDEVFYAARARRNNLIPFVRGRDMDPTTFVTLVLRPALPTTPKKPVLYELFSAWTGRKTPALPGTEYASSESEEFWSTHALVEGRQKYERRSVTYKKPWGTNQPAGDSLRRF